MELGDKIVSLRARLNMTQEELAKELSVSFSTINRWEGGKSTPTRKSLFVIKNYCKKNGVEWEEL